MTPFVYEDYTPPPHVQNAIAFAALIESINTRQRGLDHHAREYYAGGTPFSDIYADDIVQLEKEANDLISQIKRWS